MNKDCSIVQDLLPLYAENMLREETKEYVDGHLAQCEACRAELAALKAAGKDELFVCVNTASSPCVIKAADGTENFTYMVLPVRLHA